ncbi:MAG TPA: M56 family metallopeptidase [Amphiplicatus sp.]|nr:M56 family metallopeptidase [Amphiplicatus sp.]
MPITAMQIFDLVACATIAFGVILFVTGFFGPYQRVLLARCAFIFALIAPLTLVLSKAGEGLVRLPFGDAIYDAVTRPIDISFSQVAGLAGLSSQHGDPAASIAPAMLFFASLIWAFGVLIVIGRFALSAALLSKAFSDGEAFAPEKLQRLRALKKRLNISAQVQIRRSANVLAPCVFGWRKVKMLVPANLNDESLDHIFAHELCHVRERDWIWLAVARIASAAHWFNPLVWMLSRRHRTDIELVCDAAATEEAVDRFSYAEALVKAARDLAGFSGEAAVTMTRQGLATRVKSLLARRGPLSRTSKAMRVFAAAGLTASLVLVAETDLLAADSGGPSMTELQESAAAEGMGLIVLNAPKGVEVTIGDFGACWDEAQCVFERPVGDAVELKARPDRAGSFSWTGCEPSANTRSCRATIGAEPIYVGVRVKAR